MSDESKAAADAAVMGEVFAPADAPADEKRKAAVFAKAKETERWKLEAAAAVARIKSKTRHSGEAAKHADLWLESEMTEAEYEAAIEFVSGPKPKKPADKPSA